MRKKTACDNQKKLNRKLKLWSSFSLKEFILSLSWVIRKSISFIRILQIAWRKTSTLHKHGCISLTCYLLKQIIIFLPWGKKEIQDHNIQLQSTPAVAASHALCFHRTELVFSVTEDKAGAMTAVHIEYVNYTVSGYKLMSVILNLLWLHLKSLSVWLHVGESLLEHNHTGWLMLRGFISYPLPSSTNRTQPC